MVQIDHSSSATCDNLCVYIPPAVVLRQAALISFKTEISNLRSQVHQVSLERDQLRSSFSRTVEENKRIIREGDEHVDLVTKQSETRIKCVFDYNHFGC